MKQHSQARAFKALTKSHPNPNQVQDILSDMNPERVDRSLIAPMYAYYRDAYPVQYTFERDSDSIAYHKSIFIASILNLFDKMSLKHGCIVGPGLCTTMATVFGHNNRQSLTDALNDAKVRFKNPRFREIVLSVCGELKDRFEDRPVSSLQVSLFEMGGE